MAQFISSKMYVLQQKLKQIKLLLKKWNQEELGNIFQSKQALEMEMAKL